MGKLIHMLSHEMKRNQPIDKVIKADLTIMQKHILKFILLETMHKDLYQKDIEEEFQIRKSTVTGYVQLMEKNGYLTRESVKGDARKKRLVPTEKAEGLRQAILEDIKLSEKRMEKGIPDEQLNELIERAGALRKKYKGNHVSIHLLTNARSGNCSQNCAYCAQSCRSHADIEKYKWVDDEKLYGDNTFVHDHKLSRHCIGLSGMKFSDDEIEELASKIRKMKEEGTHLCCSIGFLTKKQALMLKEAGLDRINHNLNTSRSNYPNICTTHTYEQRVNNIHMLQDLGFEICSGGIIGMGESKEDVVDMLLDLKEINPEALPINFLIPIKGTPLQDRDTSNLTPEYCLKVLCLARLLVPTSDIRCAAGREIYFKGREKELLTVVNSIFASGYLTADGQGIQDTIKTITDAGFTCEVESD